MGLSYRRSIALCALVTLLLVASAGIGAAAPIAPHIHGRQHFSSTSHGNWFDDIWQGATSHHFDFAASWGGGTTGVYSWSLYPCIDHGYACYANLSGNYLYGGNTTAHSMSRCNIAYLSTDRYHRAKISVSTSGGSAFDNMWVWSGHSY